MSRPDGFTPGAGLDSRGKARPHRDSIPGPSSLEHSTVKTLTRMRLNVRLYVHRLVFSLTLKNRDMSEILVSPRFTFNVYFT